MSDTSYKLLLVDDDEFLLDIYALKFKEGGHEVETVQDAAVAIDMIREHPVYDAIVFDMVMPGMGGMDLLKAIKKENLLPNGVKIALSNQGQSEDIEEARKEGIDGYIIKAKMVPSQVLTEIVSIIEKNHTHE